MEETFEHRYCELRLEAESRTISGTIIRYGDTADIGGVFKERVEPGALSLRTRVLLNVQHSRALPLAALGTSMDITDGPESMTMRARLPDTSIARDCIANIRAGLLSGLSVEMRVLRETWNRDASERTIKAAQLVGLGVVDSPAYPQSSIEARAAYLQGKVGFVGVSQRHPFRHWYM